MREIKFRLWDEPDERFFPMGSMSFYDGHLPANDATAVMQYTGLKDSKGVEIYEGDIVRWDDSSKGEYWRVAKVVWDDRGQWCFRVINHLCVNCFDKKYRDRNYEFGMGNFIYTPNTSFHGNVLEVIGNIHENAGLLE